MKSETPHITPAHRVQEIKEYYFSRKLREVAEMNSRGADVISLGIGGPDRPPHQDVINTLCEVARRDDVHSYQPYTGLPRLREAYAAWYKRYYDVELDPMKEVLPLIGSKEGILHISLAMLNPGDKVLVPNPGYPTYTSVSRLVGAEIIYYDLTPDNWYPDFAKLFKGDYSDVKLMWVNYPNMPTGAIATPGLYDRLIEFARRNDILIVNDNPYSFILNDNPSSLLSHKDAKEYAMEMNSLSKSSNMAGWRMGMLAGKAEYIDWVLKVKSNIDSGQFRPMMEAAIVALEQGPEWYEELNACYKSRRQVAEQIMDALGCSYNPSQRGLFLWGRIPEEAESAEKFCDEILYGSHVFVTPGSIFGSNGNRYLRISLCATEEKMREALARIRHHYGQ